MIRDDSSSHDDRLDRHLEVASFQEAAEADRRYWWSRTPEERLAHLERLRRLNYGDQCSERIQRVLEIVEPE